MHRRFRSLVSALVPLVLLAGLCGGTSQDPTSPQASEPEPSVHWGTWWCLGPFDEPAGGASLGTVHPPERDLAALGPGGPGPALEETYRGKGGAELRWSKLGGAQAGSTELDVGRIDLIAALPPLEVAGWSNQAVAYLYRRIEAPQAVRLDLSLGSDDGLRLWLDGELLVDRPVERALDVRDHSLSLALGPGTHHLLAKVAQSGGGWDFQMRPWQRPPQAAIDEAIGRGVRFLLERQLIDGSWPTQEVWQAGYTAFAAYVLLKCDVPPEHAAIRRAMEYVRARPPSTTYAAATALLAWAELDGERGRAGMEQALRALLEFQDRNGRFGYPVYPTNNDRPEADLSNTLFAAMALRAAANSGLRVPERTWRQLIEGTLANQRRPPRGAPAGPVPLGFSYRPDGASTGSMTTAGISVLAIAREQLGSRLPASLGHRLEQGVQSGLSWLEQHGTWFGNPGQGAHHYYYVYGVERVGALLDLERLAGCTWYWDGADVLLRAQEADGGWQSRDRKVYEDTLLALHFLKRATHASTGSLSEQGVVASDAHAAVRLRVRGDGQLILWIDGFSPEALDQLEWPGEAGRGPRVTQVEFLARFLEDPDAPEQLLGTQPGPGDEALGGSMLALRTTLERPGRYSLHARVHVLEPPTETGAGRARPRVLSSPAITVSIENVLPPAGLRYASEGRENVLLAERATFEASSEADAGHAAHHVADGLQGTGWRCAADDEEPWVRLQLERPVRAARLSLSHLEPRPLARGGAFPRRVEVLVNGKETHVLELELDPLVKGELRLERAQLVRRIDVRVLESSGRTVGTQGVGFSEIELFLDR